MKSYQARSRIKPDLELCGNPEGESVMNSVFIKIMAVALLSVGIMSQAVNAESAFDGRLIGEWSKAGSGDRIIMKDNGDADFFLSGQSSVFNGSGSFGRCIDGGGNLCITGARMKCAYRYSFVQDTLNLQFRSGGPDMACKALSGDYLSPNKKAK